jgi:hypothetical protein
MLVPWQQVASHGKGQRDHGQAKCEVVISDYPFTADLEPNPEHDQEGGYDDHAFGTPIMDSSYQPSSWNLVLQIKHALPSGLSTWAVKHP